MAVIRVGCVLLLACLTMRQQDAWFTEAALWRGAVIVAPSSPRAAMNYARALYLQGDRYGAMTWLAVAADHADRHRDPENFERLVRLRVLALEEQGVPACQNPSLSRFC